MQEFDLTTMYLVISLALQNEEARLCKHTYKD